MNTVKIDPESPLEQCFFWECERSVSPDQYCTLSHLLSSSTDEDKPGAIIVVNGMSTSRQEMICQKVLMAKSLGGSTGVPRLPASLLMENPWQLAEFDFELHTKEHSRNWLFVTDDIQPGKIWKPYDSKPVSGTQKTRYNLKVQPEFGAYKLHKFTAENYQAGAIYWLMFSGEGLRRRPDNKTVTVVATKDSDISLPSSCLPLSIQVPDVSLAPFPKAADAGLSNKMVSHSDCPSTSQVGEKDGLCIQSVKVQKIQHLTPNIGFVYSGMGPDFRVLVRKSRKQAEQYLRLYKEPIPVTQLVRETATVMQELTQSGGVRPFGVSLLVAGYDDKGPQLYQVDPSGSYFSWKASAMRKNVSTANTFLEKRYTEDMERGDAIHTAILTLKEGFEGEISSKNIEIGKIGADKVFRVLTPAEIDDYLAEVE